MKRTTLGIGVSLIGALAACQVIAGIERVEKVDETAVGEGGTSGSTSGTSGSTSGIIANDPCKHFLPPDPPNTADPGEDLPPFYVAATDLSLTDPRGYDLDKACTCEKRAGTNFDGGAPCSPPPGGKEICDPDGGVDNQSAGLFTILKGAGNDLDKGFRDDAAEGKRSVLILIKNWNGKPNDFDVTVGIFVSNGAQPATKDSHTPPDPPIDAGMSDWSHPKTVTLQGGVYQPTALPGGYVSNGTLVVKNAGTVSLFLGNNGLTFNESLVVGDLKRDPDTGIVRFDGVVGGRIRLNELLAAAGQLRIGGTTPACQYNENPLLNFSTIKSAICTAADIGQGSLSDFKGLVCDSISSTITVTAFTATVSGADSVDVDPDNTNPCTPEAVPPDLYKCQ